MTTESNPLSTTSSAGASKKSAPVSSRRRRWLARLIVVFFALAVGFGICEIIARMLFGAPLAEQLPLATLQANKTRGWEMAPNTVHYCYHHRVEVNNLGLRGRNVPAKVPGDFRVLALGDSMIYGQGVATEETIPAYMEEILRASDPKKYGQCHVINAGLRGYSTNQELALLKELGPAISPDVLVLFWFWNDFWESDVPGSYEILTAKGPVAADIGDKPEGWPLRKWQGKQLLRRSALLCYLHDVHKERKISYPSSEMVAQELKKLEGFLGEFDSLARQGNYQLILALAPDANSLVGDHPDKEVRAQVAQVAAKYGIPIVNLDQSLSDLYQRTKILPVIPFDSHYTPPANEVMARQVVEEILRLAPAGGCR